MWITAMYYHYLVRGGGGPPLFHRYDQSLANQWDNVQGIRFAGSVQGDYGARINAGVRQVEELMNQGLSRPPSRIRHCHRMASGARARTPRFSGERAIGLPSFGPPRPIMAF